jgi:glyoxylase I family protein
VESTALFDDDAGVAPPRTSGAHHAAVLVGSLARAEAFYLGVLELSLLRRFDDEDGRHRSTWVDLGDGSFLAIEKLPVGGSDGWPTPRVGHHCLAIRIRAEDRRAWLEHLERSGVSIERTTIFSVYFRDPDGALLALSHHPEPADDAEGDV